MLKQKNLKEKPWGARARVPDRSSLGSRQDSDWNHFSFPLIHLNCITYDNVPYIVTNTLPGLWYLVLFPRTFSSWANLGVFLLLFEPPGPATFLQAISSSNNPLCNHGKVENQWKRAKPVFLNRLVHSLAFYTESA